MNVKAKDKATNKEQNITITDSSALSKEEIEKMKQEAEIHATEDRQKKELIEIRNQADTLIFSTEKALKDVGDKVKPEDKKQVEEKLEELKKIKDSSEIEPLKKAIDELSQEIQKIGAQLYQKVEEEKAEQSEPEIKGKEKESPDVKSGSRLKRRWERERRKEIIIIIFGNLKRAFKLRTSFLFGMFFYIHPSPIVSHGVSGGTTVISFSQKTASIPGPPLQFKIIVMY